MVEILKEISHKFPILTTIIELFLIQLMHTGYDTAAERHRVVPYEHAWRCIRCNEICTGDDGAIYPLRLFEAPLPKGEARGLCKRGKQLHKSEFT